MANPQGENPVGARTFLLLLSDDLSPLGPFIVRGDEEGVALREKQQVATHRNHNPEVVGFYLAMLIVQNLL